MSGVPFKVALSSNGRMLAVGYTGGQLVAWDLDHAQNPALALRNAVTTSPPNRGLAISDDGRLLATAYTIDKVAVWNIPQRISLADFVAGDATAVLKFSADSARLLAVGFTMEVFNIATKHLTSSPLPIPLSGGIAEPKAANFGSDGLSVVAVTDYYFAVWTPGKTTPQLVKTGLVGLAVSPDGTKIAASSGDQVSIWDVSTRHETATWYSPIQAFAAAFLGNGQRLALGGDTNKNVGIVNVFDLPSGQLVAQYRGGKSTVDGVLYDPHRLILAMSQGATTWPQHDLNVFVAPR